MFMRDLNPFVSALLSISLLGLPACKKNDGPVAPDVIQSTIIVGASVPVAAQLISPGGGTIQVHTPGNPVDGLKIDVPAGAYSSSQTFRISYQPIQSHQLGPDFNPLTPLLTIENEEQYAAKPIIITIPVKIPRGHFAMAFFVNKVTGELEGLPLLAFDSSSITVYTGDFSLPSSNSSALAKTVFGARTRGIGDFFGLVVTSISDAALDLNSTYNSGFTPGVDDWQFTNWGSYLAPKGHCAGQSGAAMWYYMNARKKTGKSLNGLLDNDGNLPNTPEIWQDDVLGYKFCSVVQDDANFSSLSVSLLTLVQKQPLGDIMTLKMFSYALRLAHNPQMVAIYGWDGFSIVGHAMVIWKQEGRVLYVADPNYPGNKPEGRMRRITFNGLTFDPYKSGATAADLSQSFNSIYYYRYQSPFFNWNSIADRWAEVENKTTGKGKFPEFTLWALDDTVAFVPLEDGFRKRDGDMTLSVRTTGYTPKFRVFNEKQEEVPVSGATFHLPDGKQRIGVCVTDNGNHWVGFKWVQVQIGDTLVSIYVNCLHGAAFAGTAITFDTSIVVCDNINHIFAAVGISNSQGRFDLWIQKANGVGQYRLDDSSHATWNPIGPASYDSRTRRLSSDQSFLNLSVLGRQTGVTGDLQAVMRNSDLAQGEVDAGLIFRVHIDGR
jgi:hypothetical protein